jgi:hypothetical protein
VTAPRALALVFAAALWHWSPGVQAREQTFRIEAEAGRTISQKIEVPVDRPGEMTVEAVWSGGRSLKIWIEEPGGEDLAGVGGISPARLRTRLEEDQVGQGVVLVVRIRTIGRNGSVDGSLTVRYPSRSDGPEPAPNTRRDAGMAATSPSREDIPPPDPRAALPDAGTRWSVPLLRLEGAQATEEGGSALAIRALLTEAARVAHAFLELGPPPVAPGEGAALPEEGVWERRMMLEDLGREVSSLLRLADEAAIPESAAADLRRLFATLADLTRRREKGGTRGEEATEALTALAGALDQVAGE